VSYLVFSVVCKRTELSASSLSTPPRTSSESKSTGGSGSGVAGLGKVEPTFFFPATSMTVVADIAEDGVGWKAGEGVG
jgi:hypothetical protein